MIFGCWSWRLLVLDRSYFWNQNWFLVLDRSNFWNLKIDFWPWHFLQAVSRCNILLPSTGRYLLQPVRIVAISQTWCVTVTTWPSWLKSAVAAPPKSFKDWLHILIQFLLWILHAWECEESNIEYTRESLARESCVTYQVHCGEFLCMYVWRENNATWKRACLLSVHPDAYCFIHTHYIESSTQKHCNSPSPRQCHLQQTRIVSSHHLSKTPHLLQSDVLWTVQELWQESTAMATTNSPATSIQTKALKAGARIWGAMTLTLVHWLYQGTSHWTSPTNHYQHHIILNWFVFLKIGSHPANIWIEQIVHLLLMVSSPMNRQWSTMILISWYLISIQQSLKSGEEQSWTRRNLPPPMGW